MKFFLLVIERHQGIEELPSHRTKSVGSGNRLRTTAPFSKVASFALDASLDNLPPSLWVHAAWVYIHLWLHPETVISGSQCAISAKSLRACRVGIHPSVAAAPWNCDKWIIMCHLSQVSRCVLRGCTSICSCTLKQWWVNDYVPYLQSL